MGGVGGEGGEGSDGGDCGDGGEGGQSGGVVRVVRVMEIGMGLLKFERLMMLLEVKMEVGDCGEDMPKLWKRCWHPVRGSSSHAW